MQSVNPKLIIALLAVLVFAGVLKIMNVNKKYSTQQYWENANIASVSEVPDEALKPGNKNGSVLMWAAGFSNSPQIIRALVERGADVNESDPVFHGTPLSSAAAYSNNPKIIDVLIELGAETDKAVSNGENALMVAAQYNKNPGIVKSLLSHGADPLNTNLAGQTALELAVMSGNAVAVRELRSIDK